MNQALALLQQFQLALLQLLVQPFYYVAILFILLQYTKQIKLERQLFAVKLHIWPRLLGRAIVTGLLVGIAVSLIGAFIGVTVTQQSVMWLWGVSALLMLFRIRYLCFAYAAGVLGLLQWIVGFTPLASGEGLVGQAAASLAAMDMTGLFMLVALLHLAEALLVRNQGGKLATPLFLSGKRGKIVGGYMLQSFWPVPLLLLVPIGGGAGAGASTAALPWTPLLGADWSQGWTIAALPMIIGFSELTRSMLPEEKARHAAKGLLLYSVVLAAAALLAWWLPMLLPIAALCSLLLHEAIIWRSRRLENASSPLFVHDQRGLRLLGILPQTPAEALGLQAGEIISKVNGVRVHSKADLHAALHLNSAFCKLEVLNYAGEVKFVQRARYENEHHQLGVILAPDEDANFYAAPGPASLIDLLRRKRTAHRRGSSSVPAPVKSAASGEKTSV